ncbi:uncharacterized protein SPPG_07639 [Spizellomyces punctatus DAOM BR117]|uniref:BTB domain-containing protein n=1 Tax=Spizellomyces punctatus (strain DAOM BR117) TaxID=645134 RepID=A0A0L0H7Q5_SPIPD|nr:uncharacterized protein SPPG_07639 [Spizellomyces punctatus DAOM BR117]KNC97252.1 hypothetical protein SPPG_07639 [Spizellomyces punctatus DAOM BR117]|eukprot:XP_016605292.1 hypothetical protein SPPG_07639 [Spizellomyces punctatus DAOM BR117]
MLSGHHSPSQAGRPTKHSLICDRTETFLDAFRTGRFSDVKIISHNHVYRLHRVILLQSPFFKRLLLDENGGEVVIVEGFLGVEIGGDWRVTREGVQTALRDLYAASQRASITPLNVLSILPAACFFELHSLKSYCVNTILTTLSTDTIVTYATQLERLRPHGVLSSPYGHKHAYGRLFAECHRKLSEAVLGFLCGVVNVGLAKEIPDSEKGHAMSAEQVLTRLPLCWVRRVLESDLLCVQSEFERYELVKRVVGSRRVTGCRVLADDVPIKQEFLSDNDCTFTRNDDLEVSLWSETASVLEDTTNHSNSADSLTRNAGPTDAVLRLRNYFGNLFEKVVPTNIGARKRKRTDNSDDESPFGLTNGREGEEEQFVEAVEDFAQAPHTSIRTPTRRVPAHGRSPISSPRSINRHYIPGALSPTPQATPEDAVMAGVFQTAVIYTYMTFPQLELVKRDGIVPDAVVLESFWTQAELMNGGRSAARKGFQKFRFAVKFKNVANYFLGKSGQHLGSMYPSVSDTGTDITKPGIMCSESVLCAGLQYRVLLTLGPEDDNDDSERCSPSNHSPSEYSSQKPVPADEQAGKSREVFRVLLQRNRVGEGSTGKRKESGVLSNISHSVGSSSRASGPTTMPSETPSTPSQTSPSISYRIYIFDPQNFTSPGKTHPQWKEFVKPVTACDHDGSGFVRGFSVPPLTTADWEGEKENMGVGKASSRKGKEKGQEPGLCDDSNGDLWAVVVIEF